MIQRVQSLWLLLAAVCTFAGIKFSFYSGTNAKGVASYALNANENLLLLLTCIVTGFVALLTLFMFKKRGLQLWLCTLGIVLEILLIFLYYRELQNFSPGTYSLTAILPPVAILSFFMAMRGIYKDEKIIKDSDRLR